MVRIEITEDGNRKVALITFDTEKKKFKSDYERNKFFRGLHGWKQIIIKDSGKYCYRRRGLLDDIPHVKIADSTFMVTFQNMNRIMKYFDEWANKVRFEMFEMMINDKKWRKMIDGMNEMSH